MQSNEYFYSAITGGFYRDSDRSLYENSESGWPKDAVAITDDEYKTLFEGQATGKIITPGSEGKPTLCTPEIDWEGASESKRQGLLTEASTVIADWRTELQLEMISEEDRANLIKWMAYIKVVKTLDLSNIIDEESFNKIAWPSKPQT